MYSFLLGLQYIGIVVLLIELIYVYRQKPSKLRRLLMMVLIFTIINFIGYSYEMQAFSKGKALTAIKVIYFGKPFIVLTTFIFIMEYCNVKLNKYIVGVLSCVHLSIALLVFTHDKHTLYYKNIDYTYEGVFPHLICEHGPVYILYTMLVFVYLVIIMTVCIREYKKAVGNIEKKRILCLMGIDLVSVSGLLIFLSGITKGYDSTIPAYVVSTTLLLISTVRYNLLDTLKVAKDNIVDEFDDGIIVLDNSGSMIYSNIQARNIYPEIIQGNCSQIIGEIEELSKKKEKFHIEQNIYEIHEKEIYKNDRYYGKIYIVSDVTESYRYTVNLEKQKAISEQANKAKSDFLARMSHEIRTPINSVLGMNEMVLRESNDDNIKKYAMDIKTSANSLLSIINDILDSSKIESGKLEIIPEEYELDSLLNELFNMIYIKSKEKGLYLDINVNEKLPNRLYGDDVRIRQVLINLLTNAVKYTVTGGIVLTVNGEEDNGDIRLGFSIADTGIGIKKDDLPKLFSSFERIEEERNRNIEGTGLGMNIVVNLLKLMDSELKVDSVYGKGSTFSFEIRQKIVSEEEVGDFRERVRGLSKEYTYHALFTAPEAKVLVTDDNNVNRTVFKGLLKQTKVQIKEASSGRECLELIKNEHFDIIFLDHMMPEMNGIETLRHMKEMDDSKCKDTPVIVLTANAVVGAKERYLKEGFDDFISKPIVSEKLEIMIKEYIPKEYINESVSETEHMKSEKILEVSEEESGNIEKLPELDEFEWDYALSHINDVELIKQTIKVFYCSIDEEMVELEELSDTIRNDGVLDEYRTRVHALKSSAATIGAILLSKIARLAEVAAIEKNYDKIVTINPILIEEMQKHKKRLEVFSEDSKGKSTIFNMSDIVGKLEKLKNGLLDDDYDVADEVMEMLNGYKYDEKIQQMIDNLDMQILNLDTADAIKNVELIINIIQEE